MSTPAAAAASSPALRRRDFLLRGAKAGASIAVAGTFALWLHDSVGPRPTAGEEGQVAFPDFSVPEMAGRMSIVEGADRVASVRAGLEALGGIGLFVRPGERVLLKVNAAFASPPMLCATAHPDLVGEVVRLCLAAGAAAVTVTDNPINDPASCFALSGIGRAAEAAGAAVVLPREHLFRPTSLAGSRLIRNWPVLSGPFAGVTRLIGIAPIKDHHRSGASMSMKNWYGLLGGRRNIFHQDIHTIIRDLALMIRPTLVILDGTTVMMHNGPTGGSLADLRRADRLIVSTDQVAADAFGATLLERAIADLPFIARAASAGAGATDYESLKPARVAAS